MGPSAGAGVTVERLSVELTNQCGKACWFCYSASTPAGATRWTGDAVVAFVSDCARHGVKAVSFGGGEPLEHPELCDILQRLRGVLFRSLTSNGLLLEGALLARLVDARPDKVHLSIHFPRDTERVIAQVQMLERYGIKSGINLLVARSQLAETRAVAAAVRAAGIGNERIVYLPMRMQDTPTPADVATIAGGPFQSMTCLGGCAKSPRFASIAWDHSVAWCSYTKTRRALPALSHDGLERALAQLDLEFCGGIDDERLLRRLSRGPLDGHGLVRHR